MSNISLIVFSVSLNALAQIFLKKGMTLVGYVDTDLNSLWSMLPKFINYFIFLGMLCYSISIFSWLIVLSRVDVSFAYPFLSLGYILTTVIAYAYLNEEMSYNKVVGISAIVLGTIILGREMI